MHFGPVQDVRNQGRLAAEAEQHARDVKERNRFMRQIAAQSGIMQLPGVVFPTFHAVCYTLSPKCVEPRDGDLRLTASSAHVQCLPRLSTSLLLPVFSIMEHCCLGSDEED